MCCGGKGCVGEVRDGLWRIGYGRVEVCIDGLREGRLGECRVGLG